MKYLLHITALLVVLPFASLRGADQPVVAVIDSGFTRESLGYASGWNFETDTNDPFDASPGHGDTVARIVIEANSAVRIMPIKVSLSDRASQSLIRALYYAVDNGASVINLSWGGAIDYYDALFDAPLRYAEQHGVVVVAAAGNADSESGIGTNLSAIRLSPVCNDAGENLVVGVGALDAEGVVARWSNTGRCVDLFADGFFEDNYGTSFAAPRVAATAAELKAAYPRMRADAIRARLIDHAAMSHGIRVLDAAATRSVQVLGYELLTDQTVTRAPASALPSKKLGGRILLDAEGKGTLWYVSPRTNERYPLSDENALRSTLRETAQGTTATLLKNIGYLKSRKGMFLIDVTNKGAAYYVQPSGTPIALGKIPSAISRLGRVALGISRDNLALIPRAD